MMFADDVVLCAREKDCWSWNCVMDGSLGEEMNESVKSKDRVYVSEWKAIGCNVPSC